MKEIIGKKLGMTRIFTEDGLSVPVSVIEAGPCVVVSRKTIARDGYEALQVGYGERRENLFSKPQKGHFEKAGVAPRHYLREIRFDGEIEVGGELKADIFKKGERVDVTGISRGFGFQGVMKRHHFAGAQATHGQSDRRRAPGSIGQSSYPSRVFKGMKMPGKMGKDKVTILNLRIMDVISDQNLLLVSGSIPGKKGTLVKIRSSNRAK